MGDPINDAEILTTRTISLAAALLSLRDTLATDTASGESSAHWFTTNNWFMDLFCALVLILVVHANLSLFAGLDKDIRNALTRVLSTVGSSSMRESEPPEEDDATRHRGHSGANEIYFLQVSNIQTSESFREIIVLQNELRVDLMPEAERKRWVTRDSSQSARTCRHRLREVLLFLLMFIVPTLVISTYFSITTRRNDISTDTKLACAWIFTTFPSFLYIIMEVLVWKTKKTWVSTTPAAVEDSSNEVEPPPDEESPPEVISPVHNDNNDDNNNNNEGVEMKEKEGQSASRKPSVIKTPSSKGAVSV
eukprot:CAMPEP_0182521286 /NCGR_PEP_ID=MMETSP1321-20130603/46046_1 /TAXON_ID=91990 /ORGANISM="Bolidomonas sp., Strain RCC1657" /LENGTH=306 /DNA_ID=CAMNT_0024729311 /DNA_START=952 /DNA_END=1869 /DNA_ORIENTATION=-